MLILSARHLLLIVQAFVACFNHARPHQGIGSRIPDPIAEVTQGDARIIAFPVLGGLYHDYRRVT
ncbi:MAG: hypothetical protein M5R40_00010 [Anaerolineae bacterium]|nr:hypothetical protein [Anaerolineae bacterium]